jgi:hypothetical protein
MKLYLILLKDQESECISPWHDSGEGPWETLEGALDFAKNEVGVPWMVVQIEAADCGRTVSEIGGRNA